MSGSIERGNTKSQPGRDQEIPISEWKDLLNIVFAESNVLAGKASEVVVNKHHG